MSLFHESNYFSWHKKFAVGNKKFPITPFYCITFDFVFYSSILLTYFNWLVNNVKINVSHYYVQLLLLMHPHFRYEETKAQRS